MIAAIVTTPVSGGVGINSFWVALVALLHTQFATFITGTTMLALISEGLAIARDDPRHRRFAAGQIKAIAWTFSFGSALAIVFVIVVLIGLWGRFFIQLTQITFWVFVFEAGCFLAEVVLTYLLYAGWDRLAAYRRTRFSLLFLLMLVTFWQMFFIDVVASFMLSPGNGDQSQLQQLLNPTELPLTLHRTVGNIAWAGAVVACFAAVQHLRTTRTLRRQAHPGGSAPAVAPPASPRGRRLTRDALRRAESEGVAYWDWVGQWGASWALGMSLLQPWIGYSYAKEIQLHSYPAWYRMMFGDVSAWFLVQIGLLGVIFTLAVLFMRSRVRAAGLRRRALGLSAAVLGVCTVVAVLPYHLAWSYADVVAQGRDRYLWDGGLINPLGSFVPFKVLALIGMMLAGLVALTSFLRARGEDRVGPAEATRRSQGLLIGMAVTVSTMMLVMGYIREHSRGPYLIYGELRIDQQQNVDEQGNILSQPGQPIP